jgi:RTX calcium-binding nonapeptide repeat (4 copies)
MAGPRLGAAGSRAWATAAALSSAIVLVLALGVATATPEDQIVVHGAHSGSTLELEVKGQGKRLVVRGYMARTHPRGCHFTRYRMAASCPLRNVGSIEVRMGPSGDMVRVLNRMPVPLTAYLGAGSDKFIGNGEPDICYSEGSRRNRCVGGPGRDICITGNKNSDCVGGAGNDYCHTGDGSDGCWGGPGRDVCRMGAGQDGCHGEGGDDRLFGGPSPDRLYGGEGYDHCDGLPGRGRSQTCEAGARH